MDDEGTSIPGSDEFLSGDILRILHSRSNHEADSTYEFNIQYIGGKDLLAGDGKKVWRMCISDGSSYKTAVFNFASKAVYDQAKSLNPYSVIRISQYRSSQHLQPGRPKLVFFQLKKFTLLADGTHIQRVIGNPTFNVDRDELIAEYLPHETSHGDAPEPMDVNDSGDINEKLGQPGLPPSIEQSIKDNSIHKQKTGDAITALRSSQDVKQEPESPPPSPFEANSQTHNAAFLQGNSEISYNANGTTIKQEPLTQPPTQSFDLQDQFPNNQPTGDERLCLSQGNIFPTVLIKTEPQSPTGESENLALNNPTAMPVDLVPTPVRSEDLATNSQASTIPFSSQDQPLGLLDRSTAEFGTPSKHPSSASSRSDRTPTVSQILTDMKTELREPLTPIRPTPQAIGAASTTDRSQDLNMPSVHQQSQLFPNIASHSQNSLIIPKYNVSSLNVRPRPFQPRILARLVKLSPVIGPTNKGASWVQLLFEDKTGKIQMKLWNEDIWKYGGEELCRLKLGRLYDVCSVWIKEIDSRFISRKVNGLLPIELGTTDRTTIEEVFEFHNPGIPAFKYQFEKIGDIAGKREGDKIDLLAVVSHQQIIEPNSRLALMLKDDSNTEIMLTIWSWWGLAEAYTAITGKIVAVKNAEVRSFGGRSLQLEPADGSLVIEPDLPEAESLREWDANYGIDALSQSLTTQRPSVNIDYSTPWTNIKSLVQNNIGLHVPATVTCKARIQLSTKSSPVCVYPRCLCCQTKVEQRNGGMNFCRKCSKMYSPSDTENVVLLHLDLKDGDSVLENVTMFPEKVRDFFDLKDSDVDSELSVISDKVEKIREKMFAVCIVAKPNPGFPISYSVGAIEELDENKLK